MCVGRTVEVHGLQSDAGRPVVREPAFFLRLWLNPVAWLPPPAFFLSLWLNPIAVLRPRLSFQNRIERLYPLGGRVAATTCL